MQQPVPLILTLRFDQGSFTFFEEQRRRFFPPGRNFIPAHLTLFHHLPGDRIEAISDDLVSATQEQHCFMLRVTGLRSLGRGVAYTLASPELAVLQSNLAKRWAAWLTPQDRQKHRPHVTIQNKVDPKAAGRLLQDLEAGFTPFVVQAEALDLWHYLGGPWKLAATFLFPCAP